MAKTVPTKILLSGDPIAREANAAAVVMPGMLLARTAAGLVTPHNVAAGMAQPMIARDDEYVGTGLDVAFAVGDTVPFYIGRSGDQFYCLLATANNVTIGAYLESNGDGSFRISTHTSAGLANAAAWPVAVAVEALNNVSGVAQRLRVEIL